MTQYADTTWVRTEDDVREYIETGREDVATEPAELERLFALVYGVQPDDKDREDSLWSLICAGVSHGNSNPVTCRGSSPDERGPKRGKGRVGRKPMTRRVIHFSDEAKAKIARRFEQIEHPVRCCKCGAVIEHVDAVFVSTEPWCEDCFILRG